MTRLALLFTVTVGLLVATGPARAMPTATDCRNGRATDTRTLLICEPILQYLDAQSHWNAGEPKVKATFGNDPVHASAAGRRAWMKLANYSIDALHGHDATCAAPDAVPRAMRYLKSSTDRTTFFTMCQAGADALASYNIMLRLFSERRSPTAAVIRAVNKLNADIVRNRAKVAAALNSTLRRRSFSLSSRRAAVPTSRTGGICDRERRVVLGNGVQIPHLFPRRARSPTT